jgi:hypothetical protein
MPVIEAADDARPADWLTRSAGDPYTVHAMVPDVFEAYARVFHPALLCEEEVRWSDVAHANGRTMHGAAEWGQLTGSWQMQQQAGLWETEPDTGPTPERLAIRLATILSGHTSTADRCRLGVWEGLGAGDVIVVVREGVPEQERRRIQSMRQEECDAEDSFVRTAPTFDLPSRRMHLLCGPLTDMAGFYRFGVNAPSVWWPDDRAWCVGNDVDLMATYLGGTAAAIEAVVSDPGLEALAIPAGQDVTEAADTVNPRVGPAPF